jgi:hypothetical protein
MAEKNMSCIVRNIGERRLAFILLFIFITACGRFTGDYGENLINTVPGEYFVAGQDSGFFNNFAQDKNGGIHLVYYQMPKRTILWAYAPSIKTGFTTTEVIDEAGENDNFGLYPRIVVDSKNIPHVIYIRHIENGNQVFKIYHAFRVEDNKWIVNPVNIIGCAFEPKAEILDAAIDQEDIIHIAYIGYDKRLYYLAVDIQNNTLSCEQIDPAIGEKARVPSGGAISECVNMKIDQSGKIHVVYYDSENGNPKYAFKKKGDIDWNISVVGWERVYNEEIQFSRGVLGYEATLKYPSNESRLDTNIYALAPGGRKEVPREFWGFRGSQTVVLSDAVVGPGKDFDLNIKFYINYVRIDTSPDDDGRFCAVGYNDVYEPFVAYSNSTKSTLEFAEFKAGNWERESVDNVFIGSRISIAYFFIQGKRYPAIIYPDSLRTIIKSAVLDNSGVQKRWNIVNTIARGIVGLHLFGDSLPILGLVGMSYMRNEKGDYQLFFAVSEFPEVLTR